MCADVRPEFAGLPAGFGEAVGLTPQAEADVAQFQAMLTEANSVMNLVGDSTLEQFWLRHFVDSAQLLWFEPRALTWADLGAGAGLPGLVLAILLKGRDGARVHLVESMAKRCRFLSDVATKLDLPVQVHNARAETLALRVEVVTARACAPLESLLGFARPYFSGGARGIFLKGSSLDAELDVARKSWRFRHAIEHSLSDPRGRLLRIEEGSLARIR